MGASNWRLYLVGSSFGCDRICSLFVLLLGVGTRDYYRKLGYTLDGPYMSKSLI